MEGNDEITVKVSEHWLAGILDFLMAVFRPLFHFVAEVAGAGWVGFALVFMIFFMVYLIRTGVRSGNAHLYAAAMHYIGWRGMIGSAIYLALLTAEFLFMPPVALFMNLALNSFLGQEPGVGNFLSFLDGQSPFKAPFMADMLAFYGTDHLLLPLGFRQAGLIMVAFASMLAVAKSITYATGLVTPRQSTD